MNDCNCNAEVNRDGSSQLARYLKALDPAYAPVDSRSIKDLLVFAKRYAAHVRFFEVSPASGNEKTTVSWEEFFSRDMAVIAASIGITDIEAVKKEYTQARELVDKAPDKQRFFDLFKLVINIAETLDKWYSMAIPANPLYNDLGLAINSNLKAQYKKLVAYKKGYGFVDNEDEFHMDPTGFVNPDLWGANDSIPADHSIYEGSSTAEQIRNAALYIDDIFYAFWGAQDKLVNAADQYLQFALEQYPAHQPHMALFISFLRLYKLAQDQMNGITERMLKYYYEDVLHLTAKPSIPDKVHIVFELAKDISEFDLSAGTLLNGGKDAAGKDQLYKTETDLVVNQAKVKELKTIFIEKTPANAAEDYKTVHTIYSRPVANSADGYGTPFTDPEAKWPTFGTGTPYQEAPRNICEKIDFKKQALNIRNEASIGFAVASPQLLLQGGNRLISWKLDAFTELFRERKEEESGGKVKKVVSIDKNIQLQLTGESGWLSINATKDATGFGNLLQTLRQDGIFDATLTIGTSYYVDLAHHLLHVFLPTSEKGIIAFDAKLHTGKAYATPYPLMQVMLGPDIEIDHQRYKRLKLDDLSLSVHVGSMNSVKHRAGKQAAGKKKTAIVYDNTADAEPYFDGLKTLVIQTDDGIQPVTKPFNPFTAFPFKGKAFYIGSDEAFNKPLGMLSVNIKKTNEIVTGPQGVVVLVSDGTTPLAAGTFTPMDYRVSVLKNREFIRLDDGFEIDFDRSSLSRNILHHTVSDSTDPSGPKHQKSISLPRRPLTSNVKYETNTEKGFIKIQNLKGPVQSDGGSGANAIVSSQVLAPDLEIQEISLSYYSELHGLDPEIDQFFHVYPFGIVETYIKSDLLYKNKKLLAQASANSQFQALDKKKEYLMVDAGETLLPHFTYTSPYNAYRKITDAPQLLEADGGGSIASKTSVDNVMEQLIIEASGINAQLKGGNNQYSGLIQEEGMLLIGIEKLQPEQSLSLLFQFADGSAKNEDDDPPQIHWSYLTYNEWRPLKDEYLVADGTEGFQVTGIVKIDIPVDITNNNTIIDGSLYWLCASVTEHAERIPQLINIFTQAVEAEFDDRDNDQSHFDKPLPAGSISKLSVAVSQVSKVQQPFASFDGKHREVGKEFFVRVSERLKHKNRAITAIDYERLVLNRFPSVYKVKCITHTDPECLCRTANHYANKADSKCCGPQIAPGHVLIVPIASLKNRNSVNPLQPKTGRRTLLDIEAFLKRLTSPFVTVHAKNPVYEQVITAFKVKLHKGYDKGYYLKKLNEEIVQYLTPWAFDADAEVQFGQKIFASAIINFIEQRPYVDFITDFLMGICHDECCNEYPPVHNKDEDREHIDISAFKGCDDMESFLEATLGLIGEVVATPSSTRSLLVSAPHHIIVPYEETVVLSHCEQKKMIVPTSQTLADAVVEAVRDGANDIKATKTIGDK